MSNFPISPVVRRVVYTASAGAGPYAFTFEVLAQTDIDVYLNDTLKTLTTDYTVSINANGTGSITFTSAPSASARVTIVGARDIQRSTDFVTGGDLTAVSLNLDLDQNVIFAQQNAEALGRAIIAPVTDPASINMVLPAQTSRAGKTLAFDSSGNPVVGEDIGNWRGNWAAGTAYTVRDLVKDGSNSNVYRVNTAHTSSGTTPLTSNADYAKFDLVVDAASAAASASAAAASASAASTSASNASTSASNAASSASSASTSASNASTSASNAASSASSASTSASNAAASYDQFDDRYLGSKASDPTLDNDGNALIDGALYFDTTNNVMKVYDLGNTTWRRTTPTTSDQTNINTVSGISGNITTVAGIAANVTTVAGVAANVTTVAGISGNVTTVAGISSDVTTVASNNANVTTVATNIASVNTCATDINKIITTANDLNEAVSEIEVCANNITNIDLVGNNIANVNALGPIAADITTVAGISADVQAVENIAANVTTVAGISGNVTTVAGISANVTSVATNSANINTVATNIANVNTVGGISANVTTVAGISANVTTVAGNSANITTVAGISGNVTTVAGISADVTTVATNVADITNYADTYLGPKASDPSTRNDTTALQDGDLYFNTTIDQMKVYNGSLWQSVGSTVNGTTGRFRYIATSGQTTFSGADSNANSLAYDAGYIDVYLNGVRLDSSDYTASNGTSIVLGSAAALDDELNIVAYGTFALADHYTKTAADGRFVRYDTASQGLNSTQQSNARTNIGAASTGKAIAMAIVFGG